MTDLPQVLGDFQIIREIGRGGMGVVYEARQRSLNRRVALKVLSSSLGLTERAVTRFRREAEAGAKLHHTNIVPIYTTGEDRGVYYYAMEFIDGPSLDAVIRQMRNGLHRDNAEPNEQAAGDSTSEALPGWVAETLAYDKPGSKVSSASSVSSTKPAAISGSGISSGSKYFDTVARMVADVADALEHAHCQGVIHRDIKPSNLLLSPDGRLGVNDFGLARILEQPGMTISGEFVGSPLYMSPEQISAGRAPLDHRTDIYSLGATLYELLTLSPPFPGRTRDEVIAQILHKEPQTPRKLNKTIPIDLETICLKAIARDPDRRYQTAGDLQKDLCRYVNRSAIMAKRAGPLERVAKFARRNPSLAALIAGLAAAVLAITFLIYRGIQNEKKNELERIKGEVVEAILRGDFSSALDLKWTAIGKGADTFWDRFTVGQIALYQDNYGEAIERLQEAVKLRQDSIPARSLLAVSTLWGGDEPAYFQAVKDLEKEPASNFEDFLYLGFANIWKNPDVSLALFDKADSMRGNQNIVRLYRAQASRLSAMKDGENLQHALALAKAAIDDADTSRKILKTSPMAASEFAMANLVAANICSASAKQNPGSAEALTKAAAEYIDVARTEGRHLKNFSKYSYAVYAHFLILNETSNDDGIRKLISSLDHRNTDLNPYVCQLSGTLLFQMGDSEAGIWLKNTPGLQGENCQFMEFFYEMCEPGFSPKASGIRQRVEKYIDKKVKDRNPAYLECDWCVAALLGDPEYAKKVLGDIRNLQMTDEVYDDVYRYLSRTSGGDAEELLQKCMNDNRKLCETNFVLAIEALSQGNRDTAEMRFQQSLDANMFPFYCHWWSRAFLRHMKRSPNWPAWLIHPSGRD